MTRILNVSMGESEETKKIIELLKENGLDFETQPSPYVAKDMPVLYAPEGTCKGVDGIKIYTAIFGSEHNKNK